MNMHNSWKYSFQKKVICWLDLEFNEKKFYPGPGVEPGPLSFRANVLTNWAIQDKHRSTLPDLLKLAFLTSGPTDCVVVMSYRGMHSKNLELKEMKGNLVLRPLFSLVSAFSQKNKTYKMGLRVCVCLCVCVCMCLCTILVPPYQFPNQSSDWYEISATYSIVPKLSNAINPVS